MNHNYSVLPLPCLLLFHAGGFSDCSEYEQGNFFSTLGTEFAKRGIIVINVEYRRGRLNDKKKIYRSVQSVESSYRAIQDGRGAIRSIISMARNYTGSEPYQVDTNYIFVGGASAGGVISNSLAYCSKPMLDSSFPTAAGSPTIEQVLGPVDADYYTGSPDINFQPMIKGVLNMWSGINVPVKYAPGHEYDFFTDTAISLPNKPALISFQGFADKIFPFEENDDQLIKFSPPPSKPKKYNYNSDSAKCLLDGASAYILDGDKITPDLLLISSLNMYHVMDSLGILTELYVDCTAGHGIDDGDDYGTGNSTKEQVWEYIVQRAAVFFQAVMNSKSKASLGNSLFVECENLRKRCSQSNTSCSNTLGYCLP